MFKIIIMFQNEFKNHVSEWVKRLGLLPLRDTHRFSAGEIFLVACRECFNLIIQNAFLLVMHYCPGKQGVMPFFCAEHTVSLLCYNVVLHQMYWTPAKVNYTGRLSTLWKCFSTRDVQEGKWKFLKLISPNALSPSHLHFYVLHSFIAP